MEGNLYILSEFHNLYYMVRDTNKLYNYIFDSTRLKLFNTDDVTV